MKGTTLDRIIDAFAFTGFLVLVSTGLLLRALLPPGSVSTALEQDLEGLSSL